MDIFIHIIIWFYFFIMVPWAFIQIGIHLEKRKKENDNT